MSWTVEVSFAPLKDLTGGEDTVHGATASTTPSPGDDANEDYREFVAECLADDGELEPSRRLLDRWAKRLGLTHTQAAEIEMREVTRTQLDDHEREYIDAVHFCIEDGLELDAKDLRYLAREASRLCLSDDRASTLRAMVVPGT